LGASLDASRGQYSLAGAAGVACMVWGASWAVTGGRVGAITGFFVGGHNSPHADDFDWGGRSGHYAMEIDIIKEVLASVSR
jgi:hypothetical protein